MDKYRCRLAVGPLRVRVCIL